MKSPQMFHGNLCFDGNIDLEEVNRKLRDMTPGPEEIMERRENEAYDYYSQLRALGGRPSRPVRSEPVYETTFHDGLVHWYNEEEKRSWHAEPDTVMPTHWGVEMLKFEKELALWKKFREAQAKATQGSPLLHYGMATVESDEPFIRVVQQLRDWRAYHHYQKRKVNSLRWKREYSRASIKAHQAEFTPDDETYKSRLEEIYDCLESRTETMEEASKDLNWIEGEFGEIYTEFTQNHPSMCEELKEQQKKDAQTLGHAFEKATGIKYWCLEPSPQDGKQLDSFLHMEREMSIVADYILEFEQQAVQIEKHREPEETLDDNSPLSKQDQGRLHIWKRVVMYYETHLARAQKWIPVWREYAEYFERESAPGETRAGWTYLRRNLENGRRLEKSAEADLPLRKKKIEEAERGLSLFEVSLDSKIQEGKAAAELPTPPDSASPASRYATSYEETLKTSLEDLASPTPRVAVQYQGSETAASRTASKRKRSDACEATSIPSSDVRQPNKKFHLSSAALAINEEMIQSARLRSRSLRSISCSKSDRVPPSPEHRNKRSKSAPA